jgi:hypothetical protein
LLTSDAFAAIREGGCELDEIDYWARLLAESSQEPEEREMLVGILQEARLAAAHTAARKALHLIDAIAYGPAVDLE